MPDPHDPDTWEPKDAYPPKGHKYAAKKATVDGIDFPSRLEARRYIELKMLLHAGEITDLELQPRYRLEVNGHKICDYVADFRYRMPDGAEIVEDAKGKILPEFRLKVKLLKAVHGIDLRIVHASEVYPYQV